MFGSIDEKTKHEIVSAVIPQIKDKITWLQETISTLAGQIDTTEEEFRQNMASANLLGWVESTLASLIK